jgi:hypothetical protein
MAHTRCGQWCPSNPKREQSAAAPTAKAAQSQARRWGLWQPPPVAQPSVGKPGPTAFRRPHRWAAQATVAAPADNARCDAYYDGAQWCPLTEESQWEDESDEHAAASAEATAKKAKRDTNIQNMKELVKLKSFLGTSEFSGSDALAFADSATLKVKALEQELHEAKPLAHQCKTVINRKWRLAAAVDKQAAAVSAARADCDAAASWLAEQILQLDQQRAKRSLRDGGQCARGQDRCGSGKRRCVGRHGC